MRLARLLFFFTLIAGPAVADDASDIQGVIQSQLAAFWRDDGNEAFSYAAPVIQQKFINPENFMEMVKTGYPMIYRSAGVEFQDLVTDGERLRQDAIVTGADGSLSLAHYYMRKMPDGSWRIDAVTLEPLPDLST